MNRIVLIFTVSLFLVSNFIAQERLTLNDCMDILFKQSSQYKMLELQNKKNKFNYKLSTSFKYPAMDLNLGIPFNLSKGLQDVFNSNLNRYILILNNRNIFSPNAFLSSNYKLPTGGNLVLNIGTYYTTSNSTFSNDRESFKYSFSANLSHPIFRSNTYKIDSEIEKKRFKHRKLEFFNSKNNLIFETVEKFYSILIKQRQINLTIRKKEKEDEELKEQRLKFKLGKISEIEFINKQLAVKETELNKSKLQEELKREMNNFLSFLCIDEDKLIELEEVSELSPLDIQIDEALDLVTKNNPDYKILKLNLDINQLQYETKNTTSIETDLTASALYSNLLYYLPFDKKLKNYDYALGIKIKVPIIDGGRRRAEIELSKIAMEEIKKNLLEKKKNLKHKVKEYFSSINFYKNEYLLQKEKLKILKDSYDVYKREYNNGRITFLELQNFENDTYKVEKNLIETIVNYNKNILQLKMILGLEIF